MSEKESSPSNHKHVKLAAEIGAVGVGVAGASVAAYSVWRKRKREASTFTDVLKTTPLIFEESRLQPEQRQLMARIAARIYSATTNTANGVITREILLEQTDAKRHAAQKMLSYLMPRNVTEDAKNEAFIDRRKGSVDGSVGYYATPRLIELVEVGGSDTIDQAVHELFGDDAV